MHVKNQIYWCGSPQLWKSYQGVAERKRLRTAPIEQDRIDLIIFIIFTQLQPNMQVFPMLFAERSRCLSSFSCPLGGHNFSEPVLDESAFPAIVLDWCWIQLQRSWIFVLISEVSTSSWIGSRLVIFLFNVDGYNFLDNESATFLKFSSSPCCSSVEFSPSLSSLLAPSGDKCNYATSQCLAVTSVYSHCGSFY